MGAYYSMLCNNFTGKNNEKSRRNYTFNSLYKMDLPMTALRFVLATTEKQYHQTACWTFKEKFSFKPIKNKSYAYNNIISGKIRTRA